MIHQLKEIIAEIPYGHVATIEELTESLGLSAEKEGEVTWALREIDDITVPTWRIVRDDGSLLVTTAAGDWEDQKQKLEKEGVEFATEDTVNVKPHFWSACEYIKNK
jgi:alkylated DNA nucleotide flippase Atl1